ncbi:unnamed protein product [Symbiodinium sp. CCMP2592]|nr:unnamed protein product [Symbiodinium sp. CCMP2592]
MTCYSKLWGATRGQRDPTSVSDSAPRQKVAESVVSFIFAEETHSGGQLAPYGENTFVEVPHLPTQLPMTELEAEVQRTSRVAAFLAQDAAVLSKELQGLQISLRGHARLEPDPAEAPAVSALALGSEEFRAVPEARSKRCF